MGLYHLLERIQNGDKEALIDIFLKFRPTIKKLSRNLNYEEAETDLIIAFLETIREIDLTNLKVRGDGAIVNYIYFFLKNISVNLFKRNVLSGIKTTELKLDIIVDDKTYVMVDRIFVSMLLNSLPSIQKEVIKRKFIQEFTDKEIALLLGVSRQAVNRTKNRALKNLRKAL